MRSPKLFYSRNATVMRLHLFQYLAVIAACAHHASGVQEDPRLSGNACQIRVGRDSVVRLYHSERSGMDRSVRLVLRDSTKWRLAWARLDESPAPPLVDFSNQMVIIAAMG